MPQERWRKSPLKNSDAFPMFVLSIMDLLSTFISRRKMKLLTLNIRPFISALQSNLCSTCYWECCSSLSAFWPFFASAFDPDLLKRKAKRKCTALYRLGHTSKCGLQTFLKVHFFPPPKGETFDLQNRPFKIQEQSLWQLLSQSKKKFKDLNSKSRGTQSNNSTFESTFKVHTLLSMPLNGLFD